MIEFYFLVGFQVTVVTITMLTHCYCIPHLKREIHIRLESPRHTQPPKKMGERGGEAGDFIM